MKVFRGSTFKADRPWGATDIANMGGTMRLGSYKCKLKSNSNVGRAYNTDIITERHRHRYEFNNKYLERFEESGMVASGINPENGLVEIIELKNHPFFIGAQFHPELKSTVINPHPLFVSFVAASLAYSKKGVEERKSAVKS